MAKTRLLLMSCRSSFLDNDKVYPPLALLYLKSYVELHAKNVIVDLMDNYDLSKPEIFEPYDYIGISIMTPQREEAVKIMKTIKKNYPLKCVIAGGPHVEHYFEDMISSKLQFDHYVTLDGEKSLVRILNGETDKILTNSLTKKDIEEAPRPDRTSRKAKKLLTNYNYNLGGRKATTMMMARGCPLGCKFCEESGKIVRWSSFENICKELDDIKALGYGAVYIFDDLFAMSIERLRPIVEELKKRDLIYRCNGHAKFMTDEMAFLLAETGCYEIMFGAESGSQKILDIVGKRTTVEQNYAFVKLCRKYGIICKAFLMLGLPGESHETIAETERFIQESGLDDFQLSIFYPFAGTKLRKLMDEKDSGIDLFYSGEGLGAFGQKGGSSEGGVYTSFLTADEIVEERNRIVKRYKPYSHQNKLTEDVGDYVMSK